MTSDLDDLLAARRHVLEAHARLATHFPALAAETMILAARLEATLSNKKAFPK